MEDEAPGEPEREDEEDAGTVGEALEEALEKEGGGGGGGGRKEDEEKEEDQSEVRLVQMTKMKIPFSFVQKK